MLQIKSVQVGRDTRSQGTTRTPVDVELMLVHDARLHDSGFGGETAAFGGDAGALHGIVLVWIQNSTQPLHFGQLQLDIPLRGVG